jgi:hypothetical protein
MPARFLALASALTATSLLITGVASADVITDATLKFTATTGGPDPTASWSFDDTTQSFVSFTVSWDGVVDTYHGGFVQNPSVSGATHGTWCAMAFFAPQPPLCGPYSAGYIFMNGVAVGGGGPTQFTDDSAMGQGTYALESERTFNTPEPSTLSLFGIAIAGLGRAYALRRRRRDVLRPH